jgi:ferritin-like metal-binding protein YciE
MGKDTGVWSIHLFNEVIVSKNRIHKAFRMAALVGIVYGTWKVIRQWRAGRAEKTGHAIDASISAAAKKIEKTAVAVEEWAGHAGGEKLGKGLDGVLMETKGTLDKATDLVQHALSPAK